MAAQRRAGSRAAASGGAGAGAPGEERRRRSSVMKGNSQKNSQRKWLKVAFLLSCAVLGCLLSRNYLFSEEGVTEVLAHHGEILKDKFIEVPCSEDYDSHKRFEGCTPRKCGRGITDAIISRGEAERIRRLAEKGLSLGGSDGGASILDLHSGALSLGKHFVNMYSELRQRIQQKIALTFGISSASMYLTKPTFFSRINSSEAKTTHDEYWHPHIDKVTYGSFDYTSLLYLSDYTEDFGGGRFVFMDEGANRTVEPRAGRVSFFTSGTENLHRVEKVHWGTRYAITISFTCNPDHGIGDPVIT
ncbi:2-oxoglutarate and iron-dependent oxygenase domain-containing protein 3 isoform X2 [Sphaerodactylus townsendi]|uniref:2-oxoglutarate and iron-dependent oxygenase domain-containing protein 3 isoform X2 n=1 Tax=Sphaerodactylus townsendi TaxID=933632 RepID=UPI002026F2FA|nr:2-oxoglutarate and iron-dependent oxygenase domain-containing protein 3 isoform X2 [Sphaerodactylus townsendi]